MYVYKNLNWPKFEWENEILLPLLSAKDIQLSTLANLAINAKLLDDTVLNAFLSLSFILSMFVRWPGKKIVRRSFKRIVFSHPVITWQWESVSYR